MERGVYMLNPKTGQMENVAETPVIVYEKSPPNPSWAQYVDASVIAPPDLPAKENVNRIFTNNGTWQVLEDGYVDCAICSDRTGVTGLSIIVDDVALYSITTQIDDTAAVEPFPPDGIAITGPYLQKQFQVYKYQVIKLSCVSVFGDGGGFDWCHCYFIPPQAPGHIPLFQYEGIHYTLVEQETKDIWINDEPIYQKSFYWTGAITNTDTVVGSVASLIPDATQTIGDAEVARTGGFSSALNARIDAGNLILRNSYQDTTSYSCLITVRYIK